jgi:hypothetical protein
MQTQAGRAREQNGGRAVVLGFNPDSPGRCGRELLGVATIILAICRSPGAPISSAPQVHALGSLVWR